MKLSNKVYDILKWVALVVMDAVGLFYQTMANIWGFGYGDEVLSTCAAISLLLGALLGVSSSRYKEENKEEW